MAEGIIRSGCLVNVNMIDISADDIFAPCPWSEIVIINIMNNRKWVFFEIVFFLNF